MAAYAATVTLNTKVVNKTRGSGGLAVLYGSVALSNYNSTRAEITGITGYFRGAPIVVAGMTSTGHLVNWDVASKAFKARVSSTGAEVANDVDCGTFHFVAMGVAP